jgi:hypothetical protein
MMNPIFDKDLLQEVINIGVIAYPVANKSSDSGFIF